MAIEKPRSLPEPHVPVIDPKTGLLTRIWREYLFDFDKRLREVIDQLNTP